MPIRFSTVAANADILGDETETHATPEALPQTAGKNGAPRASEARPERAQPRSGETKPGQDIHAAGFVKDKDAAEP
ncbi:MAG TPA: hypothetical protein VLI46_09790 [Ramlibacter sp.]|nr:hypothetical protein [Ramlibacter sp.]